MNFFHQVCTAGHGLSFKPCVSVENLTSSTEYDVVHVSCSVRAQNVLHFLNKVLTVPSSYTSKTKQTAILGFGICISLNVVFLFLLCSLVCGVGDFGW